MPTLSLVAGVSWVVLMILGASTVCGQDYPNKPIRIITSAPGGGGDFDARLIAPRISSTLGQPVIVDNRAQGILATEAVAKASPDGYTLLIGGGSLWLAPLLQKVSYDPIRDFSPISLIEWQANLVVVHPSVPVKSIKELIALAKSRPGELDYGSGVTGGSNHLAVELFKSMAGVNLLRIPYKGNAPVIPALIRGEVQLTIIDVALITPHLKSGKLRALAVTSAKPSTLFPELPTVAASGLPGYEAVSTSGIWAPAKTPAAIVNRLNQEVVRILNLQDVKGRLLNAGVEAVGSSPDEFSALIKSEMVRMGKVVKDAGIRVD